jgi:hypothetical protein
MAFCGCLFPRWEGRVACHRAVVATLLLAAARRRPCPIEVVEWPGGKPAALRMPLAPTLFQAVLNGRMTVALPPALTPARLDGPPWASVATLRARGHTVHRLVGPPLWQRGRWPLRVVWLFDDAEASAVQYRAEATTFRRSCGLDPRVTTP